MRYIYIYIYIYIYAKWYYFCRKVSVNAKIIYISVNARNLEEWVWYLFFPSHTRTPPLKSIWFIFILLHLKASSSLSSFSTPFSPFFVLLSSSLLTRQHLSFFLTKNSSFFKEEIKQLALRFHLQSVWVSN